jgi:hypothetical protein
VKKVLIIIEKVFRAKMTLKNMYVLSDVFPTNSNFSSEETPKAYRLIDRPLSPNLAQLNTKKAVRFGNGSAKDQESGKVSVQYGTNTFNKVRFAIN